MSTPKLMPRAKKPVKRGRRPRCPQCDGPLGESTAIITGGAYRVVGPGRPRLEETGHEAIEFLRLVWNGKTAVITTIVEAAPVCSIACLRAFVTAQIDKLEEHPRMFAAHGRAKAKSREKAKRRRG
jgi:hypothetical protein